MKRFFTNLKSFAGKAMAVALAGVMVLSVSCNQDELDSINKNIDDIEANIADLDARLQAVEAKLAGEYTTVQALVEAAIAEAVEGVEAQIVVADYELNDDGSYTLTMADGEEVVIYPEAKQNGLAVALDEETAEYYLVNVIDGVSSPLLDENGEYYFIHNGHDVPVQPQVQAKDDGSMEVSFDGGQNWYALGGGDAGFFQSVVANETSLTFTLNNGDVFAVTLPEEVNFNVKGGRAFLNYEATTELALNAKGVEEIVVLEAPKGWNVVLDGKVLTVTAPTEAAVTAGEAAAEGVVKALGISAEHKAYLAKTKLNAGAQALTLTVEGDKVTLKHNLTYMYDANYDDVDDVCSQYTSFGVYSKEDYASVDEIIAAIAAGDLSTEDTYPALLAEGEFVEKTYSITKVYENLNSVYDYENWEWIEAVATPGDIYWVIAFPFTSWEEQRLCTGADAVVVEWAYVSTAVEATEVLFNDIQVKTSFAGFDMYRAAVYPAVQEPSAKMDFNDWITGNYYDWYGEPFGAYSDVMEFEGSLFELGGWLGDINWNTTYNLYILPMDGRDLVDYTWEDVKVYPFTTADLTEGSTAVPTVEPREDKPHTYTYIYAKLTNPGAFVVYDWFDAEMIENYTTDAMIYEYLWEEGYRVEDETKNINKSGMKPGQTITFVGCVVEADGKYGPITKVAFTTPDVTYNDNLTVEITEVKSSNDGANALFKLDASASTETAAKYLVRSVANFNWTTTYKDEANVREWFATNASSSYITTITPGTTATDADGYYSVKRDNNATGLGDEQRLLVAPVDANGTIGVVAIEFWIPDLNITVIEKTDERWAATKPAVKIWADASYLNYGTYDICIEVTPAEGTSFAYSNANPESGFNSMTAFEAIKELIKQSRFSSHYLHSSPYDWYSTLNEGSSIDFVISWIDAEGNYYAPMIYRFYASDLDWENGTGFLEGVSFEPLDGTEGDGPYADEEGEGEGEGEGGGVMPLL